VVTVTSRYTIKKRRIPINNIHKVQTIGGAANRPAPGREEGGREVYLESRLLKRTVLVARAQTALYVAAGLFPSSLKSGADPAPPL
jgi:hypothetical protein